MTGARRIQRRTPSSFWRDRQLDLIDVAPRPTLTRLERRHYWVLRLVEVTRRVAARRTVATADMATDQTQPQMNPRRAEFQALFASGGMRRNRFDPSQMMATHNEL